VVQGGKLAGQIGAASCLSPFAVTLNEEAHMRMSHMQKATTAFLVFSVLMATEYPGQAKENNNQNPVVAKCTTRFGHCITICNHKFGTSRTSGSSRADCGRSCEDKILECEEAD
jgi:hypothetical protein